MKAPEIHVYRNGAHVTRIVWRDKDQELDLTPYKITRLERVVEVNDIPWTAVVFAGTLVEHQEDAA